MDERRKALDRMVEIAEESGMYELTTHHPGKLRRNPMTETQLLRDRYYVARDALQVQSRKTSAAWEVYVKERDEHSRLGDEETRALNDWHQETGA